MKRILAIVLVVSMMLSLASCGCQRREQGTVYLVTFETNGGSTVPSQTVEARKALQRPTDPTKEDHTFAGWYLDAELTQLYDFDKPVERDMTLYAKWEEGPVSGSGSSVDTYFISALTIEKDNNLATAVVSAPENCIFLVRFIEEDVYFSENYPNNKAYITSDSLYATCAVDAQTDMSKIGADIVGTLPQYYVAEAVLLDLDGNLLCNPASFIEHTARYEAFAKKTVHDFSEDDVVLKFDEAEDMNFGVLADDVIVLRVADLTIDEETDLHTLAGVSGSIKAGDKLFINDGTDTALIRVKTVTKNGEVAVILPAKADDEQYGFVLSDFYKFIKANMNVDTISNTEYESTPDTKGTLDSLTIVDVDTSGTHKMGLQLKPLEFETDFTKCSGKVALEKSMTVTIVWDLVLFGEDYFRFDVVSELEGKVEISLVAKIDSDLFEEENKKQQKEIGLGKIEFPFANIPGLAAFVDVTVELEWDASFGVGFSGNVKTTQGFSYNTKDGYQPIEKKTCKSDLNLKTEVEIKFGPKIAMGLEFLEGIVSCQMEVFVGAKIKATASEPIFLNGLEKHNCSLCADGSLKLVCSANANLKYKITKHLSGTPIDFTLFDCEWELFKFYVSMQNEEGKTKFGRGSCPNKSYRTLFQAVDEDGNPCDVAVTVITQGEESAWAADALSGEAAYLPNGKYKAMVKDWNVSVVFTVKGTSQTIELVKGSGHTEVTPSDPSNPSNPSEPSEPTNPDTDTYSEGLEFTLNDGGPSLNDGGSSYSVTGIGTCTDTDIVIPHIYNGLPVTCIDDYAFADCANLTSIVIPNSVTTIWYGAFSDCVGLTSVTIPNSVTHIGGSAFAECESLTSIEIPDSVKTIEACAFINCINLTSITIPDGITTISDGLFYFCRSLVNVTLPDSITTIESDVFFLCHSLDSITYKGTMSQWRNVELGFSCWDVSVDKVICSDGTLSLSEEELG